MALILGVCRLRQEDTFARLHNESPSHTTKQNKIKQKEANQDGPKKDKILGISLFLFFM